MQRACDYLPQCKGSWITKDSEPVDVFVATKDSEPIIVAAKETVTSGEEKE